MKKLLLKAAIVVIALSLLVGCAVRTPRVDNLVLSNSAPAIVIIAGVNPEVGWMEGMKDAFPGSILIVPEKYYFLRSAADVVLEQIRRAGARGRLILVGHSWGGLLAREIDARNPGVVATIVTIATPLDIRWMPNGFGDPFHPDDVESETPLYVVAGIKTGAEKRWWMRSDQSDGVVDVVTATDLGDRKVKSFAVFRGDNAEHSAIVENPAVISQIQAWLNPGTEIAYRW